MATVVNARDTQILATTPRLNGVSLQPNIVVDQSNVTGLGLIVAGTKQIWLAATSQIFQIPKSGATSPASITLTANVRNLTATPTLSIQSGTMSVTPALTGGAFTFAPTDMTSDVVTFRLSLTEASVTYTYDYTIVKVREGSDALTGVLTTETASLPASSGGVVSNYGPAAGNFKVYQGTNDVTSACTFALVSGGNPQGLTYSLTASGTNAGTYAVTAGFPDGVDSATLKFRATFGTTTLDKTLTLTKAKSGTNGTNGANGTNGTNGARGSQTFYVSTSATSFSDSAATTTASSNGGPILNDVVVQYNNGANFSQSKFWNGSAWVVINAVVDGNLLVSGTVGASKLTVSGAVSSIFPDPFIQDVNLWKLSSWGTLPTWTTITDGVGGPYSLRSGAASSSAYGDIKCRVAVGRQYRVSCKVRRNTAGNGLFFLRYDYGNVTNEGYSGTAAIGVESVTPSTTWTYYSGVFTATSAMGWVRPVVILNYTGSAGWHEVQDIRIEELVDSSLVVLGGITADRITTTNLSSLSSNLGTITAGNITLDSSGFIRGGQTAYNTGTGFFLGYSGSAYKLSIGNGTQRLLWDGTNLTLSGIVSSGGLVVDSTGSISGGQTAYNTGDGFWMGYDSSTYKLSIKGAGGQGLTFDGTNLSITGSFTASAINAVNTINIADNAVIVPASASLVSDFTGTGSATKTVVLTTSVNTGGAPLFIIGSVKALFVSGVSGVSVTGTVYIDVNGTTVWSGSESDVNTVVLNSAFSVKVTSMPSSSVDVVLSYTKSGGSGSATQRVYGGRTGFVALGVKK